MNPQLANDSLVLDRSPLGAVRSAAASERKVLLTTPVPRQKTAWTKARMDVLQMLQQSGYEVLELPARADPVEWMRFARELHRRLAGNGHILIEYPFVQRKRAYLLALLSRLAGVRLFALVHDLDSLRFRDSRAERETAILRLFDGLISHNRAMTQWMRDCGIDARVVDLNLFDYRAGAPPRQCSEDALGTPLKVACAGNLSWDKARYVYDPRLWSLPGVRVDLYGAFFEPERLPQHAQRFRGVFDPDQPQLQDRYHFGLVWDGSGVDLCEGTYGHYMRYNNPHKLSLYVALGLPVIVWQQAAIADFVQRCQIGLAVRDLRDMGEIPMRLAADDYRAMLRNIAPLGDAVRRGDFLHDALVRLLR